MNNFLPKSGALRFLPALFILLSAADLFAAGASAFTVEPDTVVLWGLNEGEGMVFADQVGGVELKVSSPGGKEPTWTDGKFGKALSFSGEVTLGASSAKSPVPDLSTGEVTAEAWLKPSEEGQGKQMGIMQGLAFRWVIGGNGNTTFLVAADGQPYTEIGATSKGKLTYGEWSHVAGTYDGSVIRVFINGELSGEREFAGSIIQPANIGGLTIGYIGSSDKPYFIGDINGIRISNKARSVFPVP